VKEEREGWGEDQLLERKIIYSNIKLCSSGQGKRVYMPFLRRSFSSSSS